MSDVSTVEAAQQCLKYAREVRKIIAYVIGCGIFSMRNLAEETGISDHTLQVFLNRDTDRPKYSFTLLKIYMFIVNNVDQDMVKDDREISVLLTNVLSSRNTFKSDSVCVYKRFIEYMDSSLNRINRVGVNYNGIFYIFRPSILSGRIVKTKLTILPDEEIGMMWKFKHEYRDSMGDIRETNGAVMVTIGNVYCFGRIERGFGMEVIVFREPTKIQQKLVQALIMSVDTRNQPISSRAVIRVAQSDGTEDFRTFNSAELDGEEDVDLIRKLIENPSDLDRALTLNLP